MRYDLEIGKHRKEFIISFTIAIAFTSPNNKEYKEFQWGKATVKVGLLLLT